MADRGKLSVAELRAMGKLLVAFCGAAVSGMSKCDLPTLYKRMVQQVDVQKTIIFRKKDCMPLLDRLGEETWTLIVRCPGSHAVLKTTGDASSSGSIEYKDKDPGKTEWNAWNDIKRWMLNKALPAWQEACKETGYSQDSTSGSGHSMEDCINSWRRRVWEADHAAGQGKTNDAGEGTHAGFDEKWRHGYEMVFFCTGPPAHEEARLPCWEIAQQRAYAGDSDSDEGLVKKRKSKNGLGERGDSGNQNSRKQQRFDEAKAARRPIKAADQAVPSSQQDDPALTEYLQSFTAAASKMTASKSLMTDTARIAACEKLVSQSHPVTLFLSL